MNAQTKENLIGHLAAAAAYVIFGLNIIFCKDLTNAHSLSPLALFVWRVGGSWILFTILSLFRPKEKVESKDLPKIALASFIGFFTVQMAFLVAIPQSRPVDVALISTLGPVFTMIFAAIFIKEPITVKKAGGVFLSLGGISLIILDSAAHHGGGVESTSALGFILLFLNAVSFAAYLGIFKPLILKYSVITFMKWVMFFSFIFTVPFAAKEIVCFDYSSLPAKTLLELAHLVVMATFVAYFLIPLAQKHIRPTLVSMYSYVQPIIATTIAVTTGMDKLSPLKIIAIPLVFTGVWLVSRSKKRG